MSSLLLRPCCHRPRYSRRAALGFGAAALLAGCTRAPVTAPSPTVATRQVTHRFGTTTIPVSPSRVVVIYQYGPFDTAALLGVPVVAAGHSPLIPGGFPEWIPGDVRAAVADIGWTDIKFESILAARPDLIIGGIEEESVYRRLTEIAPTVVPMETDPARFWPEPTSWYDGLRELGDIYGRRDALEVEIAAVRAEVARLGAELGPKRDEITVSVIRAQADGTAGVYPGAARMHNAVMAEAGIRRPQSQSYDPRGSYRAIVAEQLAGIEADVIIVFGADEAAGQSEQFDRAFVANPLWQRLAAVRAGQVHPVASPAWNAVDSLQAARRVVTDLRAALLPARPVRAL